MDIVQACKVGRIWTGDRLHIRVVHRYGVPHSIITNNGTNFMADEVKLWCSKMGIKLDYASVYHPQTNGQVERANGLIMSGIKPRLVRSLTESNTH